MPSWQLLRHLDWPRFVRNVVFVDVANLVIPAWEAVARIGGAGSPALDDLRLMSSDAYAELQELVDDAASRSRGR